MQLLNPNTTIAVILGACDWTKSGLPKASSFRRSAGYFQNYLLKSPPYGLGLQPDFILNLFDDPAPAPALLARARDTIRGLIRERQDSAAEISDVLIYYVGHGVTDDEKHLHLLIRDSSEGMETESSIAAPDLARVLRTAAPKQRRILIMDCCFSEAATEAFGAMGALEEAIARTIVEDLEPRSPERGTLLLCSSPRTRVSIGPPNAERTLFTGALLSTLECGVSSQPSKMLTFADLREDTYTKMLESHVGQPPRPALHQPDQQSGNLTRIPAFPNMAAAKTNPYELLAGVSQNSVDLTDVPVVRSRSIVKWHFTQRECFERHVGSYIMFTKVLNEPDLIVRSLVRVKDCLEDGIKFDLFDYDNRNADQPIIYVYAGLLFPIHDALYFFAEEASGDELFSMVTTSSQSSNPASLVGHMLAVGVTPENRRTPAGTKAVLKFRSRHILDPNETIPELGLVDPAAVPPRILRHL